MKYIELTQGQRTMVDDEDYLKISKQKWCAKKNLVGKFYPECSRGGKSWRLYWDIIGKPPKGFCVDHVDGDPLNNTRTNLRICTNGQNQANRGPMSHNKLGVKGVYAYKGTFKETRYVASIRKEGKPHRLGYFRTIQEASDAYELAAKELHGEFAFKKTTNPTV